LAASLFGRSLLDDRSIAAGRRQVTQAIDREQLEQGAVSHPALNQRTDRDHHESSSSKIQDAAEARSEFRSRKATSSSVFRLGGRRQTDA
jgi:hypothetical protein